MDLLKKKKLQAFDSGYYSGKSHFEDDGIQQYLAFQPMYRYLKKIRDTDHISSWNSKGFLNESINPPTESNNSVAPSLSYSGSKTRAKFVESCLK